MSLNTILAIVVAVLWVSAMIVYDPKLALGLARWLWKLLCKPFASRGKKTPD